MRHKFLTIGTLAAIALLTSTTAYAIILQPQTSHILSFDTGCVLTDAQHDNLTGVTVFSFGAIPLNGTLATNDTYYLVNVSPKVHTINNIIVTDNNSALALTVTPTLTMTTIQPGHSVAFTVVGYFTSTAYNDTGTQINITATCS